MSMFDSILQQLTGSELPEISRQIGADEQTTNKALSAAVPMLMGALARNASKGDGAESLHKALEKDHDGSILDNLQGFLGQAQSGPGDGILGHVLGNRRATVEQGLSQTSGLDGASAGKLMAMLAPVVMGALGKTQRQSGLDTNGLASLLGQEQQGIEAKAPGMLNMLSSVLDSDGDGDVDMNDIAKKGLGTLSKFFKG